MVSLNNAAASARPLSKLFCISGVTFLSGRDLLEDVLHHGVQLGFQGVEGLMRLTDLEDLFERGVARWGRGGDA